MDAEDPRTETLPPGGGERDDRRDARPRAPGPEGAPLAGGRYVVLDPLGAGGMGEVHAAWDRRLDRKVAVKLLRPERGGDLDAARLLREAHALARLSHPNVVTVHDVGVADDRVFVAMEFIDGPTLSAWLAAEPRSARRVVELFLEAGRGLAAVHAAGLVHRDFKPDNVMIREDGRVLVMDFGLARPIARAAAVPGPPGSTRPGTAGRPVRDRLDDATLTETGTVVGTPGFVAPEQLRGEPADARSDQYSFCVALGRALDAPAARQPWWLRRVIERGTAQRPADRFGSMDELLAALRSGLSRRRRRLAAAVTGLVALTGAGAFVQAERARGARCAGGEERLAEVWGPQRGAALERSFLATGVPFAEPAWAAAARALDRWGADWVAERRAACEATRVRGEQSERLLDLRMACYERRLREVGALLGVLGEADAATVESASDAVAGLPKLAACADAEGLLARTPPPEGPEARERLDAVERGVAEVSAWTDTGRYERAAGRGEELLAEARGLGYAPAVGEAAYVLAAARVELGEEDAAEGLLYETLAAGIDGGDPSLVGRAATELVYLQGFLRNRSDDAGRWHRLAEAALRRSGHDPELEYLVPLNRGTALGAEGRYDEAAERLRGAAERAGEAFGEDSLDAATAWNNLGATLSDAGRYDEAVAALERSAAIKESVYGREHPALATSLDNLGVVLGYAHRAEEALPLQREAMAIRRRTLPTDHPLIAKSHANVASTLADLGRLEEALEEGKTALALRREVLGEEHFETGISYNNLATTYRDLGRPEEALPHLERALEILATALGPDHPTVAFGLNNRGSILLLLGRPEEAIPPLERALAIRREHGAADKDLAVTMLHLARALDAAGRDPGRARALAAEAAERYRAAGEEFAAEAARAEELVARLTAGRGAAA